MLSKHKSYVGDSLSWTSSFADYPSSAWTMMAYLTGPKNLAVSASASGNDFIVFASSSQTEALLPGFYKITEVVSSGSYRITAEVTSLEMLQNPATMPAGFDNRSHIRKVYEAIKAVIEGRATQAEESISIAGRSLSRTPLKDLVVLYKQYETMVKQEEKAENLSKGLGSGNSVFVRWRNP